MKPNFGVVVFPGSNCDYDSYYALKNIFNCNVDFLWHKNNDIQNSDVIILPGGFSYGDYLRSGAIARFSTIMDSVIEFANKGGKVLGICNGFQILLESGLLPGVLLKNNSLKFSCKYVYIKSENNNTIFSNKLAKNEVLKIPIAHGDGNYFANKEILDKLVDNDQILFRYTNKEGEILETNNPNGSIQNIAGITNKEGNVMGMMPHPERCCEKVLGKTDGAKIFNSIINSFIN